MSWAEDLLLLLAIPAGLVAIGYGLAGRIGGMAAADRLALALLCGLGALLFSVSVVNGVVPLRGYGAACCLAPWALPLFGRASGQLIADVRRLVRCRGAWAVGASALVFQLALLWPLLSQPNLVFYDGSSNHDAFFWITGAEHLKRFDYLTAPAVDPTHPLFFSTKAIVGSSPVWGRMGTEGLLALVSTLAGVSPLKLYVVASAALFLPWLAAQWLLLRAFFQPTAPPRWLWLLPLIQPAFVFFHANANTPNLLGVLMGTLVLVGVVRLLGETSNRGIWVAIVALGTHAVLCSYPEMVPAIAAPGFLLIAREARRRNLAEVTRTAMAVIAGVGLNPLTAMRAWSGFFSSLAAVHPGHVYAGIFDKIGSTAAQWTAGITLSVPLARDLPGSVALLVVVFLGIAAFKVLAQARDPYGAVALLAGFGAAAAYAALSHFNYGWQKSIQFSAVAIATWIPAAVLLPAPMARRVPRQAQLALAAAVVLLFAAATAANLREAHKWSARKNLSTEWFEARAYSRAAMPDTPVLVEADEFKWPFFYTMWSAYFLHENPIVFGRDATAGGYLRGDADRAPRVRVGAPRVKLLGGLGPTAGAGLVWRGQQLGFLALPVSATNP